MLILVSAFASVEHCFITYGNADLDPSEIPNVVNDFDIEDDLTEVAIHNREEYLVKIERRVKEYKINVFNEPR